MPTPAACTRPPTLASPNGDLVPEIRINFWINTDEHPELAHLEAGVGRRGVRSTEVLRLLKLGAKADMALREWEGNRLTQVVQAGLLSQVPPLNSNDAVAAPSRDATRVAPPARLAPSAAGAHALAREPDPVTEPSAPSAAPQLTASVDALVSRGGIVPSTDSAQAGNSRRSGKSRAAAFMG